MKKKIIIIIPAQEKNKYSSLGDLSPWGGTTLLEWKISQAKNINYNNSIFVSTSSKKISDKCKNLNVSLFPRNKNENLEDLYQKLKKKFNKNTILWLNTTSPFLSHQHMNRAIEFFFKNKKKEKYDCLLTVKRQEDFFLKNGKLINLKKNKNLFKRNQNHLEPLDVILTGMYIFSFINTKNKKFSFGDNPIFYNIDFFSSLEIKNIDDLKIYKDLILNYLERLSR